MTEILSPVGSIDAFYAAINAGCDAVYLAGEAYGARKAIDKFSTDDIKNMINIAHEYNVKVYVTVNTLIFDDEIENLLKYTDELYLMGVDAILIQDLGLINIFSKRYPSLDLHISTQANVKTIEEVKFFERISTVKRIVLARETDIDTIKSIKENTSLEIEVFVHGAICMGYSGQCLFSSLLFSRSGNRGECAQPCRLKYSLYKEKELLEKDKYLLSPKELNTLNYIDKLIEIGVDSLKIEGRIKSPEYVYYTTKLYKERINNLNKIVTEEDENNLKKLYNRSFTKGYIFNEDSSDIVNTYRPNHQGLLVGKVISSNKDSLKLNLSKPLSRLDGIRIINDNLGDFGITVDKIVKDGKECDMSDSGIVIIKSYKIPKGDYRESKVLLTYSKELYDAIKPYYKEITRKTTHLSLKLVAKEGKYPVLIDKNMNVSIEGDIKISKAINKATEKEIIIKNLSRLENTKYDIENIEFDIDDNLFIPLGLINNMRRNLINKLSNDSRADRFINYNYSVDATINKTSKGLIIKAETFDQFIASYNLGFKHFIIYGNELYKRIKSKYGDVNIEVMLPRIINNYDFDIDTSDYIYVNDVGSIYKYKNQISTGEYMNITNIYSLEYLFSQGIDKITMSPEINYRNLLLINKRYNELFNTYPNIEVVLYDKVDLMITKYCVIRHHFNTKINCGLCNKNKYYLEDRNKERIPIIGTDTCGNRLLNPKTTCLFKFKKELENSNIKNFRINFTNETKEEVIEVLRAYLNGDNLSGDKYTFGRYLK